MAYLLKRTADSVVYGTKIKNGSLVVGAYVVLYNSTTSALLGQTTTDQYGRWSFILNTISPTPGTYEVRFYGSGLTSSLPPAGDWEFVEVIDLSAVTASAITYRGIWNVSKQYYGTSTYHEAVKAPDGKYYYSIANSLGVSPPNATYWTYFSDQFSSVATDLLLAQDVAVGRTITLGTALDDGGAGGILKTAGVGTLYTGTGGFYVKGSGLSELRIGTVNGSSALISGILWDGPNGVFEIRSKNFVVDRFGNVILSGTITAASGIIGGWNIGPTYLYSNVGAGAGLAPKEYPFFGGALYASRATAPFRVDTSGNMWATAGYIGGNSTSDGWQITTGSLSTGDILIVDEYFQVSAALKRFGVGPFYAGMFTHYSGSGRDARSGVLGTTSENVPAIYVSANVEPPIIDFDTIAFYVDQYGGMKASHIDLLQTAYSTTLISNNLLNTVIKKDIIVGDIIPRSFNTLGSGTALGFDTLTGYWKPFTYTKAIRQKIDVFPDIYQSTLSGCLSTYGTVNLTTSFPIYATDAVMVFDRNDSTGYKGLSLRGQNRINSTGFLTGGNSLLNLYQLSNEDAATQTVEIFHSLSGITSEVQKTLFISSTGYGDNRTIYVMADSRVEKPNAIHAARGVSAEAYSNASGLAYGVQGYAYGNGGTSRAVGIVGYASGGGTGGTYAGLFDNAPVQFRSYEELWEIAAPGTPATGTGFLYPKANHLLYWKSQAGIEYDLTGATTGSGITSLNELTTSTQNFVPGTAGSTFNISSAASTHTFNIPNAALSASGLVTTSAQTFAGDKTLRNFLIFDTSNIAPPSGSTRSLGTRAVLYSQVGGGNADYAIGIDNGSFWLSLPLPDSGYSYQWYGGTTKVMTLDATGVLAILASGVSTNISNFIELNEIIAPISPGASKGRLYEKTDRRLYFKNATGTEYDLTSSGITALNGLTDPGQTLATGTAGSTFNIVSSAGTHTFNIPVAGTTASGLMTTSAQTFAGNKSFSDTIDVGGGTLSSAGFSFLHPTQNWIDFKTPGINPPTYTTRSTGTKIALYNALNSTQVDYALGIEINTLWYSVPQFAATYHHKWYAGTSGIMDLSGQGDLTVAKHINAGGLLQLRGADVNVAGTLSNVAYLNQANTFTATQNMSVAGTSTTPAVLLGGTTQRWIDFGAIGAAAPAYTTKSIGIKLNLFEGISSTQVDYAIGIEANTLWYSTRQATNAFFHKWYAGTSGIMDISGVGDLRVFHNLHAGGTGIFMGPVGVGEASPRFSLEVLGDIGQSMSRREMRVLVNAGATTISTLGLAAAPAINATLSNADSTDGPWLNHATTGSGGHTEVISAFTVIRRDWEVEYVTRVKTDATTIAGLRYWIGLFETDPSAVTRTGNFNTISFSYDSALDSTNFWRTCTSISAGTWTTNTTTAAIAANTSYQLRIICNTANADVRFYVDGVLVTTHTTNLPNAAVLMGYGNVVTALTAGVRNIKWSRILIRHN